MRAIGRVMQGIDGVKQQSKEHLMTQRFDANGYLIAHLHMKRTCRMVPMHRMVAEFFGVPENTAIHGKALKYPSPDGLSIERIYK